MGERSEMKKKKYKGAGDNYMAKNFIICTAR
jgi:hypothetical protein